ncbi:MAG: DUF5103 domain-containing protein [Prevotellaceae bacterium]|nr:DUF5103 domain-containing protein [Candidatus Colivivens equi]
MICLASMVSLTCSAQQTASFSKSIKTVQVKVNGKWGEPPVMLKGGNNYVDISFDDLQHDYERYTYKITHCDSEWNQSDIYEGDYMTGVNGAYRLEEYTQSLMTEMEYNHYTLRLPNENVNLLISGNYKVEFFIDGEDEPVAQACFSILEPSVGIDIEVSANTDIDTYASHQQVSFTINYRNYSINNPETEFKPVVTQNRRWDTHASGMTPTYIKSNELIYSFNKSLIFDAGNEYRRFEILDKLVPTMNIDKMYYENGYYHAVVYADKPRINYLYDEDQDGRYYIRNNDDIDNDTESDYFYTHFTLQSPLLPGGSVFLNGDLTDNSYDSYYQMDYNMIEHQYEITLPLKQGSYNYQYVIVDDNNDNSIGSVALTEGNYHQTENEYYVYVYHRPFGERYDRLVGFNKKTYKN